MVRGGKAEAPDPCSEISFRLDQKTANFKVATASRPMQWSGFTEEKQRNQLEPTEFRFIEKLINKEGQLPAVLRLYISVALQQQKTANFKVATAGRPMQWSALTEGKQKNELAQTKFCFIKTITIIRGGNTVGSSPQH